MDVRVTGRVQGVSYRAWTKSEAEKAGLSGWVRNHGDGSVVAHFEGSAAALAEMKRHLYSGPAASQVEHVIAVDTEPQNISGFEIRETLGA
ncbi:acylphosphatase [Pelagovum pacificum]